MLIHAVETENGKWQMENWKRQLKTEKRSIVQSNGLSHSVAIVLFCAPAAATDTVVVIVAAAAA